MWRGNDWFEIYSKILYHYIKVFSCITKEKVTVSMIITRLIHK